MAEKINDGGPAFPKIATGDGINYSEGYVYTIEPGMSLRAYIATAAMQGLLTADRYRGEAVRRAIDLADSLIAELENPANG